MKPGSLFLALGEGRVFSGPLSAGAPNYGNDVFLMLGYSTSAEKNIGLAPQIGLSLIHYRQDFTETVFLQHRQTGLSVVLPAFIKIKKQFRISTGINCFIPVSSNVMVGEKKLRAQDIYTRDGVYADYEPGRLQAAVTLGADYWPGKKQQFSLGIQISQKAVSPVRTDSKFNDNSGHTIVVSEKLKPVHLAIKFQFKITAEKIKPEPV